MCVYMEMSQQDSLYSYHMLINFFLKEIDILGWAGVFTAGLE
jgi:hypothetical protein